MRLKSSMLAVFKNKKIRPPLSAPTKPIIPSGLHRFTNVKISLLFLGAGLLFAVVLMIVIFQDDMARLDKLLVTFKLEPDPVLAEDIRALVTGYPIERMIPYLALQDRQVAAYLVAIAKKESQWGERVPVLDGQDCFNYWGYRAESERMGSDGHTCFDNPQQAVRTVSKRLRTLIHREHLNTTAKLVVWKCGYSCDGHSTESVASWIGDVEYYYRQLMVEQLEGKISGASISNP